MSARVAIGQRGSSYGLWAAPPGQDVFTSAESALSFNMVARYEQIALIGIAVAGSPVVFSFTSALHVLLLGAEGGVGYRPYPSPAGAPYGPFSQIGPNGYASVSNTQFTMSYNGYYAIFRRSF